MSEDYYKSGDHSRDGYKSQSEGGANGNRFGGGRPRFSRGSFPAGGSNYGQQRGEGGYRARYNSNGYYASDENRQYGNRSDNGGYQNRQRQGGGYRPRYNSNDEGGFQPRTGGYRGGKSRYGQGENGGYQQADGYRPRTAQGGDFRSNGSEGGYRPRFQGNGSFYGGGNGRPQQQRRGNYDPHAKYSNKKRMEYKEENYDPTVPVRLNKYLANAGVCSRRDADKYIEAGVVSVNGQVVTELGTKVLRSDEVKFHDNVVKIEKKVYVLLNKPKGYVTTSDDPQNRKTVMDLVSNACHERIYPVGRLDRNTTGVLLLTNDGELASKLTHPKFLKKKIYHVTTDQNVSAADLHQIAEGITLEDGDIKADAIEYASPTDKKQVGIEIHSGKNRIVRRIFESLGYHVVKLDRVYFAGLTKKNVRRGDWRYLTEKEVQMLRMGAFE